MTLQETLVAFSRQQAGTDDVMRALCTHDGWFAPVEFAYVATKSDTYERISLWGAESKVAAHQLYLFTDRAAAEAAAEKAQLGPYASPVAGAPLFGGLPGRFKELHVNPASPKEQGWFMADGALGLGRLWGQAIALEQSITRKGDASMVERLFSFPGFTCFAHPSGAIATFVGAAGLKSPAVVFTAPDCAALALQKLDGQTASLKQFAISGEELFRSYPRFGVDGLVFNPFGPGPVKVLDDAICRHMIETLAARDELKRLEALAKET